MKWNELRRIAESHGWFLLRTGGNHDIYAHPQKEDFLKIERHGSKEVKNWPLPQVETPDRVLIIRE